ncbi:MAG: hypothetical protein AABW79_04910 [Nanoarchaeota archaeon]
MIRESSHLKNLVDYIVKNSNKGYSRDSLRWSLIRQGNMKHEVDKAFQMADQEIARQAPKIQPIPEPKIEAIPQNESISESEKPSFWKRLFS